MRRRRRELTREEIELWRHVTRDVEAARSPPPLPEPPPPEASPPAASSTTAPARRYVAPGYTPPASMPAPGAPPLQPLGRPLRQRIARGRHPIDAAIDLHGMRQTEAHHALHAFLLRSHREDARVVLVVTGKGSVAAGPEREAGVLRRIVPHWLRGGEWRALVLGFEEAGRGHGGDGALYVRLRRRRSP